LIISQTTTTVTGTRQVNKEVCDKTRNTLVFCFSGRKKRTEEHLRTQSVCQCRTRKASEGHENFTLFKI
jgi:hypothetical protein